MPCEYLDELTVSGFISRDFTWSLKSGSPSRLCKYRLRDNYLRFYLRYIAPYLNKIKNGQYKTTSLSSLPGWDSIMGLQFENIVLNNRAIVHDKLGISVKEIISKLALPCGYSCVPVLIHANGVSDELLATDYFYKIIDFDEI